MGRGAADMRGWFKAGGQLVDCAGVQGNLGDGLAQGGEFCMGHWEASCDSARWQVEVEH